MVKPSAMGATFAERAAAARGEKDWTPPEPKPVHNTTFAERAGGEPRDPAVPAENSTFASRRAAKSGAPATKAVEADDEKAENKAVAPKRAVKK